ncbi:hypothetical protein [Nostoc sp.]|uniref:hypothetical protein n=1 Tax=Nostoc sp. TaxID=1180 RepID=UPI002FFCCDCF
MSLIEIIKNYPKNEVEVDGVVYRRRHRLESAYPSTSSLANKPTRFIWCLVS